MAVQMEREKDDGGGGDNRSCKTCKAPFNSSPPTNQHPTFLQAGCPSCHLSKKMDWLDKNESIRSCSSSSSSLHCCVIAELLITAGGENVSPILIEDAVREQLPCVSNCMLIGDRRKFLSMLITLKVRDSVMHPAFTLVLEKYLHLKLENFLKL